jgi:hypothetical protein
MAEQKPSQPQPQQPVSPAKVPTGNPGTRDDGPHPQTGTTPLKKE